MRATPEAELFIRENWDDYLDLIERDPIKFVTEVANPWLRERRREGKNFPVFHLGRDDEGNAIVGIHGRKV